MICSSKYNRKMYRAVSPKPRLFCFVLIAVFHRLRTNSSRPGTRKTVVIFCPASSASEGTRVLTRKVGTTLTLPGLFFSFTTGETNRTNASTLCSVDSKSFVGTGLTQGGDLVIFSRKNILSRVYIYKNVAVRWRTLSDVEKEIINCHVCLF